MVIKLYISRISGNKEVKKKQQRVQMILDSKQITYEAIDITEPGKEKDKEFMQQNGKVRENLGKYPLPPQIFNDEDFCGDYEDFDLANEVDELEKFLHIEISPKDNGTDTKQSEAPKIPTEQTLNKNHNSTHSCHNPYEYHTFKIKLDGVNGVEEEISKKNDLSGQNNETEEIVKTEVNGESEVNSTVKPSAENVEISDEVVVAQEEEESSTKPSIENDENAQKESEEVVEDKPEPTTEDEVAEKTEEGDTVENPKEEEEVENLNEEKSPLSEEERVEGEEVENTEKVENEDEENKDQVASEEEEKEKEEAEEESGNESEKEEEE